jgi:hypothetical protein
MHLRKALTVGAAILVTGLLGLTPTAQAIGSPVAYIGVNGSTSAGTVAIDGIFRSGIVTMPGAYGCTGGTLGGTVSGGPVTAAPDISLPTFTLMCPTSVGPALITAGIGCVLPADFAGATVNDGSIDSGAGPTYFDVSGSLVFPASCVRIVALGGLCAANLVGPLTASFDEAVTTVGGVNYQRLILNGTVSFANQSFGCIGQYAGNLTFHNVIYDLKVTSGTTTGIDFRVNP